MKKSEVAELVSLMAATWPRPPVKPETIHAYSFALEDLDYDLAKQAVRDLMQTSRFFPTIAEIRERAVSSRVSLPTPEEAWGIVHRAIGSLGAYRSPAFDCDEIQAAVDALSWRSICLDENEAATRARFIDAFKNVVARRLRQESTGTYTMPDRLLPANAVPHSGKGDPAVRVSTGYGTPRPQLLELEAADRERAERNAKLLAAWEEAHEDEGVHDDGNDGVRVDLLPFLSRFPSKRDDEP